MQSDGRISSFFLKQITAGCVYNKKVILGAPSQGNPSMKTPTCRQQRTVIRVSERACDDPADCLQSNHDNAVSAILATGYKQSPWHAIRLAFTRSFWLLASNRPIGNMGKMSGHTVSPPGRKTRQSSWRAKHLATHALNDVPTAVPGSRPARTTSNRPGRMTTSGSPPANRGYRSANEANSATPLNRHPSVGQSFDPGLQALFSRPRADVLPVGPLHDEARHEFFLTIRLHSRDIATIPWRPPSPRRPV